MSGAYSVPVSGNIRPYSLRRLINISDDIDRDKPLVIEVGGERIPLKHAYVVTKEEAKTGNWSEEAIGTLVLDFDI